jgi:recombination protein RecA
MPSISLIRSYVESRLPGALFSYTPAEPEMIATGIKSLDRTVGGIPKSGLTQICAPAGVSTGRTTLLLSVMQKVTRREESCALVDASDCFDPASAEAAGVDMSRLLWVRCGTGKGMPSLEQAFRASDIIVQNGGFGLITVDLGNIEERLVRKVPLSTWFRFARVVEKMPTALVFLLSHPAAQSCSALTLHCTVKESLWHGCKKVSHANFLSGLECEFEIGRSRMRKPPQSIPQRFTATSVWA